MFRAELALDSITLSIIKMLPAFPHGQSSLYYVNDVSYYGSYQFHCKCACPSSFPIIELLHKKGKLCLESDLGKSVFYHGFCRSIIDDTQEGIVTLVFSSPLLLLDGEKKSRYYPNVSISQAVSLLLKKYPDVNIATSLIEDSTDQINCLIQHQESDWSFLKRILALGGLLVVFQQLEEKITISFVKKFSGARRSAAIVLDAAAQPSDESTMNLSLVKYTAHHDKQGADYSHYSPDSPFSILSSTVHASNSNHGLGLKWSLLAYGVKSDQHGSIVAKNYFNALDVLHEQLVVDCYHLEINVGDIVDVFTCDVSGLKKAYQVICLQYDIAEIYQSKYSCIVRLTLIPLEKSYQLQWSSDIKLEGVKGYTDSGTERCVDQVARYPVRLPGYENMSGNRLYARLLLPFAGDHTGFHHRLSPNISVLIGFLYRNSFEPVIIGCIADSTSQSQLYKLGTQCGFLWEINEEKRYLSVTGSSDDLGYTLDEGKNIRVWSSQFLGVQANGEVNIKTGIVNIQSSLCTLHAQKDWLVRAGKDMRCYAEHSKMLTHHWYLQCDQQRLLATQYSIVVLKYQQSVAGDLEIKCSHNYSLSGDTGLLESKQGIKFSCGPSSLEIGPQGVTMKAPVIEIDSTVVQE